MNSIRKNVCVVIVWLCLPISSSIQGFTVTIDAKNIGKAAMWTALGGACSFGAYKLLAPTVQKWYLFHCSKKIVEQCESDSMIGCSFPAKFQDRVNAQYSSSSTPLVLAYINLQKALCELDYSRRGLLTVRKESPLDSFIMRQKAPLLKRVEILIGKVKKQCLYLQVDKIEEFEKQLALYNSEQDKNLKEAIDALEKRVDALEKRPVCLCGMHWRG